MNYLKIIFSLLLSISALSPGFSIDQNQADSLESLLRTMAEDTNRVNVLNELSWLYKDDNLKKARHYAAGALALAKKLDFRRGIGDAHTRLGLIFNKEENYDSAIVCYDEGLHIRKELGDSALIASSYLNIGNIYKSKGDYDSAIGRYLEGLNYLSRKEDWDVKAKIYNKLGNIFVDRGDLPRAISYFRENQELGQSMHDTSLIAGSLMSIGGLYVAQQHHLQALAAYSEALKLYEGQGYQHGVAKCYHNLGNAYFLLEEYGKALEYFQACISLKTRLNILNDLDHTYQSIGAVYQALGNLDEALHYHNISLQLRREAGKQAGIAHSLINIGQIKLEKKQYKEALKNLLEALPATEKQHELFVLEDLYGKIAWAYSGLGEHEKAFLFSQKKASLADSLESTYHRSVELQRLLEAEKQKRVKIEAEAQLELQKSRNSILYTRSVGGVLLLGAALFVLTFWSSRIRAKKELAEKKEQFALLRIDDLMKGQEIQSNYARFEGQEIERKRIAKDLHDRLGSMLATIKLYFKAIDKRAPFLEDSLLAQYDKAKSLLDEACEEIRHISHNLESGGLREYGLVQQIATLAEHLEFSQLLKVHFHTHGLDGRLGPLMEVNIYRIIQELVTNVLKHAKASELTIQLNKFDHTLNIMVEDNGVGFTKEDLLSHKYHGIGIQNIAGRVKELNGQMSIDSGKGGGTTVSIDIPFKN